MIFYRFSDAFGKYKITKLNVLYVRIKYKMLAMEHYQYRKIFQEIVLLQLMFISM